MWKSLKDCLKELRLKRQREKIRKQIAKREK